MDIVHVLIYVQYLDESHSALGHCDQCRLINMAPGISVNVGPYSDHWRSHELVLHVQNVQVFLI